MKSLNKPILSFVIILLLLHSFINLMFPSVVFALEPDLVDQDVISTHTPPPQYYWLFYNQEYDQYAINQINIDVYNDYSYRAEPIDYPCSLNDQGADTKSCDNTTVVQSKTALYKSKFAWLTWKKYDGEFKSFKDFRMSNEGQFSLRRQFKKDFSRAFLSNRK